METIAKVGEGGVDVEFNGALTFSHLICCSYGYLYTRGNYCLSKLSDWLLFVHASNGWPDCLDR